MMTAMTQIHRKTAADMEALTKGHAGKITANAGWSQANNCSSCLCQLQLKVRMPGLLAKLMLSVMSQSKNREEQSSEQA
jgi:hypothetical protein